MKFRSQTVLILSSSRVVVVVVAGCEGVYIQRSRVFPTLVILLRLVGIKDERRRLANQLPI